MKPPLKHVIWQDKSEPADMDIAEKRLIRAFKRGCMVRDRRGCKPQAVFPEHAEAIKLNTKRGVASPKTCSMALYEISRWQGTAD